MNGQTLTKERNYFLTGCLALVLVGSVSRLLLLQSTPPDAAQDVQNAGAGLTLLAKLVFVYLVFRLSRFLRQPVWLTIAYCVLTPFSLLYLIPFVGLLVGIRNARRALVSAAPSAAGQRPAGPVAQSQRPREAPDAIAFCMRCGTKCPETAAYCSKCGAALFTQLKSATTEQVYRPQPEAVTSPPPAIAPDDDWRESSEWASRISVAEKWLTRGGMPWLWAMLALVVVSNVIQTSCMP